MSLLPTPTIVELIDNNEIYENPRSYIGYSSAGQACDRAIWYKFHWVKKRTISARLQRIFSTGHIMEEHMIKSLESIGIIVTDEQKEVVGPHGHIKGHIDGLCTGVPGNEKEIHLVEFKTANDKRFKNMQKIGIKRAEKGYYGQAQAYMGKLELKTTFFMVYNKNDSSYYIEIIPFDLPAFERLENKLLTILYSEFPLDKIGTKTWFECKFCDLYNVCHNNEPVNMNCRTCEYVEIEDDGEWKCSLKAKTLSYFDQNEGCYKWGVQKEL